jgi:hypothetical protein
MTEGRAALVGLMQRYLAGLMGRSLVCWKSKALYHAEAGESSLGFGMWLLTGHMPASYHLLAGVKVTDFGYTDGIDVGQLELVRAVAVPPVLGRTSEYTALQTVADLVKGLRLGLNCYPLFMGLDSGRDHIR